MAAAHSAAQIAMVMVLVNAHQDEHLTVKSRKEILAFHERYRTDPSTKWPDTKLAAFMDLYDACAKRLPKDIATAEHRKNLRRLNSLRNHWTHFGEDGSSVSIGLARIAVQAGVKLVIELSPTSASGLYHSRTNEARYEIAVTSLLRLLDAAQADDATPSDEDDYGRYAELETFLDEHGDEAAD